MGLGNTLQNAPYLYGYTGNRVHGIFSDFAEFTLEGETVLSNLVCDTGLVRGFGMYRQNQLTFGESSTLHIYGLSAGQTLYSTDTAAYAPPYNPSEAKPFHVLWTEEATIDNGQISV